MYTSVKSPDNVGVCVAKLVTRRFPKVSKEDVMKKAGRGEETRKQFEEE